MALLESLTPPQVWAKNPLFHWKTPFPKITSKSQLEALHGGCLPGS